MVIGNRLKVPLASKIADEIRHDIFVHILKEDELLNEAALSEKYGISRGPVRDAINMLANEGIVTNLPNGRTKVVGFKAAEMQDYYHLRLYIESEAIKKILLQQRDDQSYAEWLEQLSDLISSSKQCITHNYDDKFHEIDNNIHLLIVQRANSNISTQVWKMLSNFNRCIMTLQKLYLTSGQYQDQKTTLESHERIYEHLRARNLDDVLKELRWHIENSVQIYKHIIASVSELHNTTQ